jgi:peptidoglycan/LPS O-acetylase OafA/YrhL
LACQPIAATTDHLTMITAERSATPFFLDASRAVAALCVVAAHVSSGTGTGLPPFEPGTRLVEPPVAVFFVISGYVIALTARRYSNLGDFLVARLARLWSVLLIALALTLICDAIRSLFFGSPQDGALAQISRLMASATFLNAAWSGYGNHFGSNGPLWSLSYEAFYYVGFAFAFYLRGVARLVSVATLSLLAGPPILMLAPPWVFGAACAQPSLTRRWPKRLCMAAGFLGFMFLAAVPFGSVEMLNRLLTDDPVGGLWQWPNLPGGVASALAFAACLVAVDRMRSGGAAPNPLGDILRTAVRLIARWSFAIYLCHLPLLLLIGQCLVFLSPGAVRSSLVVGLSLTICEVVAEVADAWRPHLQAALQEARLRHAAKAGVRLSKQGSA